MLFSPGVKCQSSNTVELPGSYGSARGAICGCDGVVGSAVAAGGRALETAIRRAIAAQIYAPVDFINSSHAASNQLPSCCVDNLRFPCVHFVKAENILKISLDELLLAQPAAFFCRIK